MKGPSFLICLVDSVFLVDENEFIELIPCDFVAQRYTLEFVTDSMDMNFDVSFKVFVSMNNDHVVSVARVLVHRYSWLLFEYLVVNVQNS